MERVKKGEKYWYVICDCDGFYIGEWTDNRCGGDNALFELGNYFATKEEAEAMANKLRAVLKGAEVIELPSEEEIWDEANKRYPRRWSGDRENSEKFDVFMDGAEWLKSQLTKEE